MASSFGSNEADLHITARTSVDLLGSMLGLM